MSAYGFSPLWVNCNYASQGKQFSAEPGIIRAWTISPKAWAKPIKLPPDHGRTKIDTPKGRPLTPSNSMVTLGYPATAVQTVIAIDPINSPGGTCCWCYERLQAIGGHCTRLRRGCKFRERCTRQFQHLTYGVTSRAANVSPHQSLSAAHVHGHLPMAV